ncbi:DMT family transporter [Hylemonella sp. W303a]|uniref:DMT family transporter n=1 Tax=Hylemonella sp. W303a TaxID=3389873 RepID=UPI00396B10C2
MLGVLIFSLTLPMTRVVVAEWPPLLVGLGRALVAALPAAVLLAVNCSRLPSRQEWPGVLGAALGIVIGWPLLSTLALKSVAASHGAVFNGLLPLSTALFATWRSGERPTRMFWVWAALGAALVTGFGLLQGRGALQPGDLWLLLAVVAGGFGYAEGARAARTLGGGRTICWALVISAPLIAVPVAWMVGDAADAARVSGHVTSNRALLAFAWLSFGSMFLGFFAWYRGLAVGGIARVGQVQLLQPFLTVLACALLFGESVGGETWVFALAVIAVIAGGRQALRGGGAPTAMQSKSR